VLVSAKRFAEASDPTLQFEETPYSAGIQKEKKPTTMQVFKKYKKPPRCRGKKIAP